VRDLVCEKNLPITGAQYGRISNLHGIRKPGGEGGQKTIQGIEEGVGVHSGSLKFKDEGADSSGKSLAKWLQDHLSEETAIEKPGVGFTGLGAISGEIGIGGNRQLFPHLRAKVEIGRNLAAIVCELGNTCRPVEGMVDAHGAKERRSAGSICGVFGETILGETAGRIGPMINLIAPSLIGPGTGAETNK
jgi:hypothetical protein